MMCVLRKWLMEASHSLSALLTIGFYKFSDELSGPNLTSFGRLDQYS